MRHPSVIEKMTLEEKAALLSGKNVWETWDIPRLNIPSVFCADGPHGIRKQAGAGDHLGLNESLPATCFPAAATVANSWNVELGYRIGEALGKEAVLQKVHVVLGPGLNIKRNPLCGRNFEYYSEDPYLSGKMASAYVKGTQSQGVYACPKHFAVNNQEFHRMTMNAVVDERTLREIYLTGFEMVVKEGKAKALMTSYNEVNGVYANENQHLLQDILRREWGYDGIVITDWGGSNDHVAAVAARANLEMPSPGLATARELIEAVEKQQLSMAEIDLCVDDLLEAIFKLSSNERVVDESVYIENTVLARKAVKESAVLLKNTDNILPLKPGTKVAVIGDFAFKPRYQGAGSSRVNVPVVETIKRVIKDYPLQVEGVVQGYLRSGEKSQALKSEAVALAKKADVVIYCFGLDEKSESEGVDRCHMSIADNQIELLEALAKANHNIVGILSAGAAVELPWEYCIKGLLHGYLYGQAGASAMLDIITGAVNPSGHLSETYPIRYDDVPSSEKFISLERSAEYREGSYVGYRYYEKNNISVRYPFGYGLSYTTFEYSDLKISEQGIEVTVSNTGAADGSEVVQMYVGLPGAGVFRPQKELKGFCKVHIPRGESRVVQIPFDEYSFRYWNVKTDRWEIEKGRYHISVGSNSANIKVLGEIDIAGTAAENPYDLARMPAYYAGTIQQVNNDEFAALLGCTIPGAKEHREIEANDPISQIQYAKSGFARFINRCIECIKKKGEKKGQPDLNILFVYSMPFRAIAKMTNGIVDMEMVRGMLKVVNGHFFKGIGTIVKGYFQNSKANRAYKRKLVEK